MLQAYEAAIYIDANASFVGKALWVFLFSAVSFAYVLLFLYELRLLVWAVILQIRWYLTKLELLDCIVLVAALKEIARPSSFDSVTKVQSAIDYYKAPQSLENEDQCPKVCIPHPLTRPQMLWGTCGQDLLLERGIADELKRELILTPACPCCRETVTWQVECSSGMWVCRDRVFTCSTYPT